MGKKTNSSSTVQQPLELLVSHDDAAVKVRDRIERGKELLRRPVTNWEQIEETRKDFYTWNSYNAELVKRLFTNDTLSQEYSYIGPFFVGGGTPTLAEKVKDLRQDIDDDIHRLESIMARLELFPVNQSVENNHSSAMKTSPPTKSIGKKAFVVHGHDEGARESVARFLEKLGIHPIILHEQASGGRTIIEKLEYYSDVDFAVILLTPDDVGAEAKKADRLSPRARQNVVLELGYFIAKLGRSNVCALHRGSIELPSDYLGVIYVSMDDTGWRILLAKELRQAGFSIDLNTAL
jgi:predicted nucleotide-binding protein